MLFGGEQRYARALLADITNQPIEAEFSPLFHRGLTNRGLAFGTTKEAAAAERFRKRPAFQMCVNILLEFKAGLLIRRLIEKQGELAAPVVNFAEKNSAQPAGNRLIGRRIFPQFLFFEEVAVREAHR